MRPPAKKPCVECPMRRVCLPGWLGAEQEPEVFLRQMHSDHPMPCHLAVDYEDPDWRDTIDQAPQCAGQAIYLSNVCKRPRPGPDAAHVLPADRDLVFATPVEFLKHHTRYER